MSNIDSSTLLRCLKSRIRVDNSFAGEAARNSQDKTVYVQEYSFADNIAKNSAGYRSYDWENESRYTKKVTPYNTGSVPQRSFMPTQNGRATYQELEKLKKRIGQRMGVEEKPEWIGNQFDNAYLEKNIAKCEKWLENGSLDVHAYERKHFQSRMDHANGEIYSKRTAIKSLRDELEKAEADLHQLKTRERQLEEQLDIAQGDLNKSRNALSQVKDLAEHEHEQRLHMQEEYQRLLQTQKQHIYKLQDEIETERSVAKQSEADEDLVRSLEKKIQRLRTEMEMERRLKIEAKKDQEEIQEELDEILEENESIKRILRQSQQDNKRLEDEQKDLIEEYKSLIENQIGEELDSRIIEARNNDNQEFNREREASATEIEKYRIQCEQIQQQKDESDERIQRNLEELEALRSELANSESYRQQDIDGLLHEKESLRMELKAKKAHLQNLEIKNQELVDCISQKDREMRKLRCTAYFGNIQGRKFSRGEQSQLEEDFHSKSHDIADLERKIKELEAALEGQQEVEVGELQIKDSDGCEDTKHNERVEELEAEISKRDSQIADLKDQNKVLREELKIQHDKSSEEIMAIQEKLSSERDQGIKSSQSQNKLQADFDKELKELKEINMVLQKRCEDLELVGEKSNTEMQELEANASKIALLQEQNDELITKLKKKDSVLAELEHTKSETEILRNRAAQLETEVKTNKTIIQEMKEQVCLFEELKEEKLCLEKSIEELKQNLQQAERNRAKKEGQFDSQSKYLNEMVDRLSTQEAELRKEITERDCEIKGLKDGLQTAQTDFKQKEGQFETDLQELQQQINKMEDKEQSLSIQNADLESQLGEKQNKIDDSKLEKQNFDETVNKMKLLESKVADLEESKLGLEKRCQSLKKQLQDKKEGCKYLEAKQQDLFTKLTNEQKKYRDLVEKQNETGTNMADSSATRDEFNKKISEYEAVIAEKEATMKQNEAVLAECEAKLVKSEEERQESENNLDFSRKVLDKWSEEFDKLKADNFDLEMKLEYHKNSLNFRKDGTADYERMEYELEDLRENVKKMKEREERIQSHNYSMKKKVDASEILEKELRKQIKDLDNELNIMRSELGEARFTIQTQQNEKEVSKMQSDNWEELKGIVEQRKIQLNEKNKLLEEIDEENRNIRAEVRKLQSTVRELEGENTVLESDKEELRRKKKSIEKQLKKKDDVRSILKRTEDDLGRTYEDIEVLAKEKKELVVKCKDLEDQIAKIAGGKNKEESKHGEQNHKEEQHGDQIYDYESDFEEDEDENSSKSGIKNKNKGDSDEHSVGIKFRLGDEATSDGGSEKTDNCNLSKKDSNQGTDDDDDEIWSVSGLSNNNVDDSDEHSAGFRFNLAGETVGFDLEEDINPFDLNESGPNDCNNELEDPGMGNRQPSENKFDYGDDDDDFVVSVKCGNDSIEEDDFLGNPRDKKPAKTDLNSDKTSKQADEKSQGSDGDSSDTGITSQPTGPLFGSPRMAFPETNRNGEITPFQEKMKH